MMQSDQPSPVRKPPPPGAVRLFLRMGGWGVVGLGFVVVVLSLWAEEQSRMSRQFADTGTHAQGRVLERLVKADSNIDGSISYHYGLAIGFDTGRGEEVQVIKRVFQEEFEAAHPGMTVDLRYLPARPEQVWFGPVPAMPQGRGVQYWALGLGVLALIGLWRIGRQAVSAVNARQSGLREEAVVVGLRRSYLGAVDGERYRLIWKDADGQEGRSLTHKRRELSDLAPGTPIRIYRDGAQMWWDGDVGVP